MLELVLACVLLLVGGGLVYKYVLPSSHAAVPLPSLENNSAVTAKQPYPADAFAAKSAKKQALLERARQRYLQLHPEFQPPSKLSKAL
ncbi:hypothetical protein BASA81_009866 [Batrachochytrium salamandrivorans]|nr:hypothetical protein BASA81_009866 [Batrachochytrium salamandrivorans]